MPSSPTMAPTETPRSDYRQLVHMCTHLNRGWIPVDQCYRRNAFEILPACWQKVATNTSLATPFVTFPASQLLLHVHELQAAENGAATRPLQLIFALSEAFNRDSQATDSRIDEIRMSSMPSVSGWEQVFASSLERRTFEHCVPCHCAGTYSGGNEHASRWRSERCFVAAAARSA